MLDREHRKAATRIAAVHAAASLALGVLVGGMWLSAIFVAVVFIAIVVIVKDAGKGTSRLRAGIVATAVGIFVFWPWAGIRVFTFLDWPAWLGFVIGIVCSAGILYGWWKFHLRRPTRRRVNVQHAGAAIAAIAVIGGLIAAILFAGHNTDDQLAGPTTTDIGNGQTVEVRKLALDEPLVGDGANIAAVPVLNDGKGLITSWGNLYDRTVVMSPERKANVIANANTWHESTKRMYPDQTWMWFPSWSQIESNLRFLTGEFRVIALVNFDTSDEEARRLIQGKHPELPANLPVVRVKGAIINSECGSGDCNASPVPAKQFVDANGQIRVMLTNPIQGKSGNWVPNISAAEYGVGLGTECGNGFLGARSLSEEVKQTLSKAATGNGTTSVTTTAVLTTTTVTPSSSTTTRVTTTTPTGSTTTVTTTTPTSTTTTTSVTTTTGTTTTTTSQTTTTNTTTNTTTTTPPVTTTTETTTPKDTVTPSYTEDTDIPDATETGPATSPTVPSQPAGTTSVDAPAPPIVTAPGATTTEPPSQPTGTFVPDPTAVETGDVDPDGAAAAAPQQDPPTHQNSAPVVAPLAPAPEEAATPETESAPAQAPVVITSSAPAAVQPQQSQAPVAPSSASQEKVSSSSVSAGDIDNTASSQETGNNSGIILIAIIGTGGLGIIGGSALYRRRHPREKMAHKA